MNKIHEDIDVSILDKTDEYWYRSMLDQNSVTKRMPAELKNKHLKETLACASVYALEFQKKYKNICMEFILEEEGLDLEYFEENSPSSFVLFGQFILPNTIRVNQTRIDMASKWLCNNTINAKEDLVKNLIIGHELFHYIEENTHGIYTRNQTYTKWNFLGISYTVKLNVLSEIGAMAFTKIINNSVISPCIINKISK